MSLFGPLWGGNTTLILIKFRLGVRALAGVPRGVALQNLLHNAWKFTEPRTDARVEFRVVETQHGFACLVRDNGVGFDMRYADKLFAPFQRLHKPSEFPGTGVGLATVQRVVGRHGGRVWAEAAPGVGASFYFTLPRLEVCGDWSQADPAGRGQP